MSAWKALYVLPLVGISLAATAETKVDYQYEDAVLLSAYRSNGSEVRGVVTPNNNYAAGVWDTSKPFDEQETVYHMDGKQYNARGGKYVEIEETQQKEEKKPVPFQHLAQKPGFNGGDAYEFSKWVAQNLTYPEKSRQAKVEGRVTLQFTITETGKVTDVKVLRGVNEELDNEAVRVISQSPLWTPGKTENGEVVPVTYTFPVIFKCPVTEVKQYQEVDVKPTFNGGDANQFAAWVASQIQYPDECKKDKIGGRVFVEFVIGKDGKVADVKLLRGAHEKLDAEAIRVVSLSPEWTPGRKDGEVVPVRFTFPVVFKAQ
jgi:TonB family protein